MQKTEVGEILTRIGRLERRNRRLGQALSAALLLMGGSLLLGGESEEDKPTVIEAERFVIRDAEGKAWGELGVTDNGFARLALRDGGGRDLVWLSANEEGSIATLVLKDKGGKNRLELVGALEASGMNLNDAEGGTRVRLYAAPDDEDESRLEMFAPNLARVLSVSVSPAGSGTLRVLDGTGETRWEAP